MSSKISQFFNPAEHLVFHQDKEGNMIGGGYRVNNLLYQHKMPLFVSVGAGAQSGGGGSGEGGDDDGCEPHFIPDKFSDLFRDLAVPAGLFMMPAMFRPRNYAFEVPEAEAEAEVEAEKSRHEVGESSDSDDDDESDYKTTKHAPNDIFDTLLSLVEAKERIHHDVKTRRHRSSGSNERKEKKRPNKTRRGKVGAE
jgi:hypothetical protein